MARNHFIVPTAPVAPGITARLGAAAGAANNLSDLDVNKIVKLSGESTYNLAVAGDDIEGVITSVESAPQNGIAPFLKTAAANPGPAYRGARRAKVRTSAKSTRLFAGRG